VALAGCANSGNVEEEEAAMNSDMSSEMGESKEPTLAEGGTNDLQEVTPNPEEVSGSPAPEPTKEEPKKETADLSLDNAMSELGKELPPTENTANNLLPLNAPTVSSKGGGGLPKIPTQAFMSGKNNLNRFYFLRKGDNPQKVSLLIYGNASFAPEMKAWNKGAWKPGKVIFYQSPNSAEDNQMVSFYQERNLAPEEHTLANGENLASLAKNVLGTAASWKEIAVLNGLRTIKDGQGQRLALYPNLGAVQATNDVAQNASPTPPQEGGQEHANVGQDPNQAPQDPANTDPASAFADLAKKKKGLNIGRLLQQNGLFLLLGLGTIFLLLALLAIGKRKKDRTDFADAALPAKRKKG